MCRYESHNYVAGLNDAFISISNFTNKKIDSVSKIK